MNLKNTYRMLNKVVVRHPIQPINHYHRIPKDKDGMLAFIKLLFEDKVFKEGIYLASPELYTYWKRMVHGTYPEDKVEDLMYSILKYYIRASTNCVPFGLFASYSIQDINSNTEQKVSSASFERFTNIDSTFVNAIIKYLKTHKQINDSLTYSINDTIIQTSKHCRYIEGTDDGEHKKFTLSSLETNPVLNLILEQCEIKRRTRKELENIIFDHVEGVIMDEIKDFVNQIIDAQLLIDSFEMCINGDAPFEQLCSFLNEHQLDTWKTDKELIHCINTLHTIHLQLKELTYSIGTPVENYQKIYKQVKELSLPISTKTLLSTNLKRNIPEVPSIKNNDEEALLKKAIKILSIFSTRHPEQQFTSFKYLKAFKEAFIKRYEDEEVPLLKVMDSESGIGYTKGSFSQPASRLIDDIEFPLDDKQRKQQIYLDHEADAFWFQAILKAQNQKQTHLQITDDDIHSFEHREASMKGTFPILYSKLGDQLCIRMAGGSTALHYLGRFTANDVELASFGKTITEIEATLFEGSALAEVLHVPTNAAGNIAMRHVKRTYEIPILTTSSKDAIHLPLQDLMVSVLGDQILLRSKSLNKQVIPFLSCAQNFHEGTIDIYHFLCDLQSQYRSNVLSLDVSDFITSHFNYIPRIQYGKGLILAPARWQYPLEACKSFLDDQGRLIPHRFSEFKIKEDIPRYINLSENGDDALTIDTENPIMYRIIETLLKKKKLFRFSECMYDISSVASGEFANEYVASFVGDKIRSVTLPKKVNIKDVVKKTYIPGDDWLYFKVYTGVSTADTLLIQPIKAIIEELLANKVIDQWFFIRFYDPDFHLRIRFRFTNPSAKGLIIDTFNKHFQSYVSDDFISKIELATYERELSRYQFASMEDSERLFFHDSMLVLQLLSAYKFSHYEFDMWVYSIRSIDSLFNAFQLSINEKLSIASQLYIGFSDEFQSDKKLKKQIDHKFRTHISHLEAVMKISNPCIEAIHHRDTHISEIALKILKVLDKATLFDLLESHVHMHINRMVKANPRMHELLIYGILEKYYRRDIGRQKYLKSKEKNPINIISQKLKNQLI